MTGYPVLLHTAKPLYVLADPAGHPFCLLVQ